MNGSAYAVFARSDGKLRVKRWSIGAAPGFPVTPHPTQIIGSGTPTDSADEAVIFAAGDRVAVAWLRCDAILARVSDDGGQTWGPERTLVEHAACGGDYIALPRSISISGDRIVMAYLAFSFFGGGITGLIKTRNDFATFRDEAIAEVPHDEQLIGFVSAGGGTKLAAAFDRGDRIRYRRQQ